MKPLFLIIYVCIYVSPMDFCHAQVSNDAIRRALSEPSPSLAKQPWIEPARKFYSLNGYRHRWLKDNLRQLEQLSELIQQLPGVGLIPEDYTSYLSTNLANELDSVNAEIGLTLSALGIVHDLVYGRKYIPLSYNGWKAQLPEDSTPTILNHYLQADSLSSVLIELQPSTPEYIALRKYLCQLLETVSQYHFTDIPVKQLRSRSDSSQLWKRMFQLGIPLPDSTVQLGIFQKAVRKIQALFSITPDGHPGNLTLNVLNVPIRERIDALGESLNTLRWIYSGFGSGAGVVVNIPSAELFYYENNRITLVSRIIPGKPSTPTPTLTSMISEVVLYPYWHVPYSIATQELLPLIKKNPGFINAGNYQLLNSKGKIVDPKSVSWSSINSRNFPYVLRQSTGCDNALGWIKLNFYNPYSVYLHDTPGKMLFNLKKRFLSHGCMRVEKASELARKILAGNTLLIDSLEKIGPLKNQSPITLKVLPNIPVAVVYQRAWFDSSGNPRFYEDIYRKQPKR